MSNRPLVIDLDGTLICSDTLVESGFAYLKAAPHRFYKPILWLICGGKPCLKDRLAKSTNLDVTVLPYDEVVLKWLKCERDSGRSLVLATASHERYASAISAHLGLFDETFATQGNVNLSGDNKRIRLVSEYGEKGFDYAGNSREDIEIWRSANRAYVVNANSSIERAARKIGNVEQVIESRPPLLSSLSRTLRLHQWLKNLLILLPPLAGHQFRSLDVVVSMVLAFIAFSLCASSVYVFNDLLDLEDDRYHPVKRHRPFASGALPLQWGIALVPLLLAGSFAIALASLPPLFSLVILVYYALTLAYSTYFKRQLMIDVVVLAMLYTTRIIAGTAAANTHPTFWLLAFTTFLFLSLALVKRYAELYSLKERGLVKSRGRSYVPGDLPLISSLGAASGYLAVLVLALYIQDPKTTHLYQHPQVIWLALPLLLYWISRTWLFAHRGLMHDDPIIFAVRDRVSIATAALSALVFWAAT